ncbi:MAG: 16S rRNA (guanine(966)-N(2))-methyltransferase RsmD [Nitrospirota bacterium]
MRVIAGRFKGRRLRVPKGYDVRPTSDMVRSALFNILGSRVERAKVMDLFAGTGSVGLEALSRGAAHALFVEDDPAARASLEANLAACGVASHEATVWSGRGVAGLIRHLKAHPEETAELIFADPPYRRQEALRLLRPFVAGLGLAKGGYLVVEHAYGVQLPPPETPVAFVKTYRYGDTALSLFEREAPA